MKIRGATCSSPSTAPPAGSSSGLQNQNCGPCTALFARARARLPDPHPYNFDRQRQGIHRPSVRPAQARGDRAARVRQPLRRTGHRAPPDTAEVTPDQRHGRTLQRPHRGGASNPPLPIWRGAGDHAASICLALQPTTAAVSLGQQNALARDEGVAQTQARAVQKIAVLPSGMGQLAIIFVFVQEYR